MRLRELERNAESVRTLYESFLGRFKQSGTTDAQFRDLVGELRGELAPRGGRVFVIESQPNPGDACPYQGQ